MKHPLGAVLSIDTTGPFTRAYDASGCKVAYILVGALTWTVPKDSTLREEKVPEPEGEAPNFEARKDEEVIPSEDQPDQPPEEPQGIFDDEVPEEEECQRAPDGKKFQRKKASQDLRRKKVRQKRKRSSRREFFALQLLCSQRKPLKSLVW